MSNTLTLFARQMTHIRRSPETIVSAMLQPIALMLLFVYVFGGALKSSLPDGVNYVNYQLPGILIMAIGYNTSYTSLRMFNDRQKGITNRFNSMPISRSAALWAHVLASVMSCAAALVMVFLAAFLMGFRSGAGIPEWLSAAGILLLFALALTWLAVIPGLLAKTPEGSSFLAFPLVFLPLFSSSFAPTETMPGALRWFAENQPVTSIVESIRALLYNEPLNNDIYTALAWCAGIMAVAWFTAIKAYKRQMN